MVTAPHPKPDESAAPFSLGSSRVLGLSVLALLGLSWLRRFVVDDAFISFRYAHHMAEGHGLVWNPGEAVEGYTNFLWTLLMTLPHVAGIDPVPFSQAAGLIAFVVTLVCTWRVGLVVLETPQQASLATVLLGLCPSAASWATGGLETSMQTALLCCGAAMTAQAWADNRLNHRRAILLSLVLGAAFMTRMDSAILGSVIGLTAVWRITREPRSERASLLACLALPFLAIIGAWFAWKMSTYGGILPNTWHAKVGGHTPWGRGATYLGAFASTYLMFPLALVPIALWRCRERGPALVLLGALCAWCLYLARVGGDFMGFRFLVPALPYLFLLLVWGTWHAVTHGAGRAAVIALILGGFVHHETTFEFDGQIEPVAMLHAHLDTPAQDWRGVGQVLGDALGETPDVAIATTAAGVIPYLSRVGAVDMIGLTDPWVAANGKPYGKQWGHDRIAPMSYLLERGVHLVLGQPWIRAQPAPEKATHYGFQDLRGLQVLDGEQARGFPPTASVLEIPLDETRRLVALYLRPHPAIENAIARLGWRRFGIRASGPDATL
ncbi:MAG: hypothetical protein VYE15_01155 [Myxococcota bacterium]|nr:hypothetical protein [Myxococcota bacterium]